MLNLLAHWTSDGSEDGMESSKSPSIATRIPYRVGVFPSSPHDHLPAHHELSPRQLLPTTPNPFLPPQLALTMRTSHALRGTAPSSISPRALCEGSLFWTALLQPWGAGEWSASSVALIV